MQSFLWTVGTCLLEFFHSSFLCSMDISSVYTSLSVASIKDRKNTQMIGLCRTVIKAVHFSLKLNLATILFVHNTFSVMENTAIIHTLMILLDTRFTLKAAVFSKHKKATVSFVQEATLIRAHCRWSLVSESSHSASPALHVAYTMGVLHTSARRSWSLTYCSPLLGAQPSRNKTCFARRVAGSVFL